MLAAAREAQTMRQTRLAQAKLIAPLLICLSASGVVAQTAIDPPEFEVDTQHGNDTLFVGQTGSIIFYLNVAGWNASAVTMPLEFDFGGAGNLIGPISEDSTDPAYFAFSADVHAVMENAGFNNVLGADFTGDPDSLLFGVLDFDGVGLNIDGELCRITFTPSQPGVITIERASVPPAATVAILDQSAQDIPYIWHGPYTITVVECPVKMGDVNADGTINSADLIYMVNYIFKSGPDPLPMRTVGDANCTGGLGGSDIIYLVNYIFKGGQPPCACYVWII
jgi:hypothetical protein